jgi:hypothetical protein
MWCPMEGCTQGSEPHCLSFFVLHRELPQPAKVGEPTNCKQGKKKSITMS